MSDERLAVVAHELRSPVAALVALAERASMTVAQGILERLVALAIAAGRDVERLVSDEELVSLRPVEVDLHELLRTVAPPGVVVTAANEMRLVCDPTRVRQAIANLVANGLRHGRHVAIEARRHGDLAVIRVRDDGPGVDAGIDPFARGVSAVGSTGYGLWLAREIAEAHGGRLEHARAPHGGTTFTLSLPVAAGGPG